MDDINSEQNSILKNSNNDNNSNNSNLISESHSNTNNNNSILISESHSNNNDFNYHNNQNNNNYVFYANNKINLRSPNDFIFLGDELHLYREIPHLGNFYSYKNKSVKGIFLDKTICMMNQDQYYAKIINKYGDKELLFIPDLPSNNRYYIYVKHLFDFYDACFNPQVLHDNAKRKMELEKQIDQRINKIDLFNNLIFNKNKEYNYSKQYYVDNIPTVLDIQNLLKRNQKALDNIEQIKYQNHK